MPVIPLLHAGPTEFARTPSEVAAYLVRHLLLSPGFVSEYHENEQLSFRVLEANHGRTPSTLASRTQLMLSDAIHRAFPSRMFSVIIDHAPLNDGYFRLIIDINDGQGDGVIYHSQVDVNNETLEVVFER